MSAPAATDLTALDHLHELWRRSLICVAVLFVGASAGYIFRQPIINFLQRPLGEQLYYTSPMGSFNFVMQVCLLVGLVVALPIICYNLLRFVEPALSRRLSIRLILGVLLVSFVLAMAGVAFAYYLTLPPALHFFRQVGTNSLRPLISINQYFSFILGYLGTFAVVFQLPLALLLINHITPFGPGGLRKWRKFVFIGAFAISLIMPSSPDPLSQISLAIPIIALYEISSLLIWMANRKKSRRTKRAQNISTKLRKKLQPTEDQLLPELLDLATPETPENIITVAQAAQPKQQVAQAKASHIASPRTYSLDGFTVPRSRTATALPRANYQQALRPPTAPTRVPLSSPRIISDIL